MRGAIKVRGFYHLQILDSGGKIVGDSGRIGNAITNLGWNQYLVSLLGAIAGSKQIGFAALGTGTQPGAADTTLQGEVEARTAVTAATSSSSKVLRFTFTFGSAGSFVTNTQNISNCGLFASSAGGTIFAGGTVASSAVATNEIVSGTYDISFS